MNEPKPLSNKEINSLSEKEIFSRISEIEIFLTGLIISTRGTQNEYKPSTGDKYQPLRNELKELRRRLFDKKDQFETYIEKLDYELKENLVSIGHDGRQGFIRLKVVKDDSRYDELTKVGFKTNIDPKQIASDLMKEVFDYSEWPPNKNKTNKIRTSNRRKRLKKSIANNRRMRARRKVLSILKK